MDSNSTSSLSLEESTPLPLEIFVKNVSSISQGLESGKIQIPLYAVIFLLAVIGNSLVILTLVQNQRMRTITNVFLLNLAVSDLLLGVLCMPFTLVGTLLRDFIFGRVMCKFLPFLQASSVSVSAWTLVAISVERYYAICHPLRSRRWQTLNHAYRLIVSIWIGSLICMTPIALLSQLIPTSKGHHKCRDYWPTKDYERMYNLFLDMVLLVVPLLVLAITYTLITRTLWKGMRTEIALNYVGSATIEVYINSSGASSTRYSLSHRYPSTSSRRSNLSSNIGSNIGNNIASNQCYKHPDEESNHAVGSYRHIRGLRRTNAEKSLTNKKRVIKMLCAVVLEFFICWTPLYVINTIALFNPDAVYNGLGYTAISFFQLLAYSSSCCNPITYCFMNCGFRKSFLNLFRCCKKNRNFDMHNTESVRSTKWSNRLSTRYSEAN